MAEAQALAARGVVDRAAAIACRISKERADKVARIQCARWLEEAWAPGAADAWKAVATATDASPAEQQEARAALTKSPAAPSRLDDAALDGALDRALRAGSPEKAAAVLEPLASSRDPRVLDALGLWLGRAGKPADAQRSWARGRTELERSGRRIATPDHYRESRMRSFVDMLRLSGHELVVRGFVSDAPFAIDVRTGRVTFSEHNMVSLGTVAEVGLNPLGLHAGVAAGIHDGVPMVLTDFPMMTRAVGDATTCQSVGFDSTGDWVAFSCDQEILLTQAHVSLQTMEPEKVIRIPTKERAQYIVAVAEGGAAVAVRGLRGRVVVYERSGRKLGPLGPERSDVTGFAFLPSGRALVAWAQGDGGETSRASIELVELKSSKVVKSLDLENPANQVRYSPAGKHAHFISNMTFTRLDLETFTAHKLSDRLIDEWRPASDGPLFAGAWIPDAGAHEVGIYDASGTLLHTVEHGAQSVFGMELSPSGRYLAVATGLGVGLHDLEQNTYRFASVRGYVPGVVIDEANARVISVEVDGDKDAIRWRSFDDLKIVQERAYPSPGLNVALALSPSGELLLPGSESLQGKRSGGIRYVAGSGVARGGGRIAIEARVDGRTKGLEMRDESSDKVLYRVDAGPPFALASTKGWLVATKDRNVVLYDERGAERCRAPMTREPERIAIDADGSHVAVGFEHQFLVLDGTCEIKTQQFAHAPFPGVQGIGWLGRGVLYVGGSMGVDFYRVDANGTSYLADGMYWGDGGWGWYGEQGTAGWSNALPTELAIEEFSSGLFWEGMRDDTIVGSIARCGRPQCETAKDGKR
jgi:hypothetical protein